MPLLEVEEELHKLIPSELLDEVRLCATTDSYWNVPGDAQFIRVRESYGKKGKHCPTIPCELLEVTVKNKDMGNNLNRLERNVNIQNAKQMVKIFELAFGAEPKVLKKDHEVVIFLKDGTVFSLARVNGKETYFEVETQTAQLFNRYVKLVEDRLGDSLVFEAKSLYELYIK